MALHRQRAAEPGAGPSSWIVARGTSPRDYLPNLLFHVALRIRLRLPLGDLLAAYDSAGGYGGTCDLRRRRVGATAAAETG